MAKILLVEDDPKLAEDLIAWLKTENNTVEHADNGQFALDLLKSYHFDLMILDWDIPEVSGIEVCRSLRQHNNHIPILMLTGKGELSDKETGLDSGCDDYLAKPFNVRELGARLRALLRRPVNFTGVQLRVGNITLEPGTHRVTKDGIDVSLSKLEYALLEFLMRHPDQVFSPEALLNSVWSSESGASIDTVRTYIKTLRKKLANSAGASIIHTIFGVGYKVVNK